jgi:hypothetical protein
MPHSFKRHFNTFPVLSAVIRLSMYPVLHTTQPLNDRHAPNTFHFYNQAFGLPMWSSGQSSWLQIQRSRFDSRHYQIFWEVVGLELCLCLVSTIEELLERKSSGSSLENLEYYCRDPSCWPCGTVYLQKLALTSPTGSDHSVGIARSRTQATEFSF